MNLNPFAWFAKKSPPVRTAGRPRIQARYDNAGYNDENARNWWNVDIFSAKAANSWQVRRTLRIRSRYEVANNPYLFGVCDNNAADIIDTGPTLQVLTESESFNKAVQARWNEWAAEIDLVEKLTTLKLASTVDGEGFLILKTVEDLENSVKLYPVDIEADQVSQPSPQNLDQMWVDGITLHPVSGRPVSYSILRHHPGDLLFKDFNPLIADTIAARFVVQSFRKFRPGQVRGIPVFTSALDLFSELRAYRRAILQKAQVAANLTAVLECEASGDSTGGDTRTPFDTIPMDRGTMTTVPAGETLKQFETGEPSSTYEGFREACLGEACRPLAYPLNLALGTSQKFNFSSAKLDFKNYYNRGRIERTREISPKVSQIFRYWWEEAIRIPKYLPRNDAIGLMVPPHAFHWPSFAVLDEKAETDSDIRQINAGTTTWQKFWATRGYDWQEVMAQQAKEREEMERLKLVFGDPLKKDLKEAAPEDSEEAETANVD